MSILLEALELTSKTRQEEYGDPNESYETVAQYWETYLGIEGIKAQDVCTMLMLMKIGRETSKHKRDNLADIAGYAELVDRLNGRK